MFDMGQIVNAAIKFFLKDFYETILNTFTKELGDIMGSAINILDLSIVVNGIKYTQALALSIIAVKVIYEIIQSYIMYEGGDPDADPGGILVRTSQAVAVISTLPWIVREIFTFGTKVVSDVASMGISQNGIESSFFNAFRLDSAGIGILLMLIIFLIMFLIVGIQATIRGGELALMAVTGPLIALNLTSTNKSLWAQWFKQVVVICLAQALQIFMIKGFFALHQNGLILASEAGILPSIGWMWVTIKTPKYLQQISHSTGFTGAMAGGAKQAGSMYLMRKMMAR